MVIKAEAYGWLGGGGGGQDRVEQRRVLVAYEL
eukprot:COSAG05_NODE_12865_length_451_cov_1.000000_1_plen_32_part_10